MQTQWINSRKTRKTKLQTLLDFISFSLDLVGLSHVLFWYMTLLIKGKRTQKYKLCVSKCIWKTVHFGANCMEIRYLLLKIMQFYVFKMAANGARHFETNFKTENYKTQFISQKHANSCTFDKCDVIFLCNQSFSGVILWILYFYKAFLEKNQYPLWASDVTA